MRFGLTAKGLLAALLLGGVPGQGAQAAPATDVVVTEHVRAQLVAHAPQGVAAGKPVMLGLEIAHQPEWHTYWKNPGDSGLPTSFSWTLPAGFGASEIAWPAPQQLPLGPLMNYGYANKVLLPVTVTVPAGFSAAALTVSLRAEWLVCKEICIPESGQFQLELPANASSSAHAALFDAARRALPQTMPGVSAQARAGARSLDIDVTGLPASLRGKTVKLFVEDAGVIDYAAAPVQRWDGERLLLQAPLAVQRSESPAAMRAVLSVGDAAVQLAFPVSGWSAAGAAASSVAAPAPAAPNGSAPGPAPAQGAAPAPALASALLLAFLGGLLLNLMPCVFPVLSLKVLAFAQHAGERRRLVAGGLAYSAGVILSFLALAGLLLALRAGGQQLGWGFQLQSPLFVAAMAVLFTLIGLNLAGLFEFGSVLPGSVAGFRARHPVADDALSGALAVAVASPCSAPFMGAALGAALTLPAVAALSVFGALGLGMASPYLAASLWPALARRMPRPGLWMVRFKVIMAFPMFGTVVWLCWVLGHQTGADGVAALLGLLVAIAYAAWTIATPVKSARARTVLGASGAAVTLAVLAWALPALHGPDLQDASAADVQGAGAGAGLARGAVWQPWSADAVAAARAAGRPVFVDFTAAWCVTCQFNKRTALADPQLLADFAARRYLLLRADWTRADPAITRALAGFGRSGVPVYALYPAAAGEPVLLSEVLTVSQVRDALQPLALQP